MIPEIDYINRIPDPDLQYQWLLHYYKNNIINYQNIHLCRVSGDAVNLLAFHVQQHKLSEIAIIKYLYRLAIFRGSIRAKYNLAVILSHSTISTEINESSSLYRELYNDRSLFSGQQVILDSIYYAKMEEAYYHGQLGNVWRFLLLISTTWHNYDYVRHVMSIVINLTHQKLIDICAKAKVIDVTGATQVSSTQRQVDDVTLLTQQFQALTHQIPAQVHLTSSVDIYEPNWHQSVILAYQEAKAAYDKARLDLDILENAYYQVHPEIERKPWSPSPNTPEIRLAYSVLHEKKIGLNGELNRYGQHTGGLDTAYYALPASGYQKELQRQIQSEKRFFAPSRNRNPKVQELAHTFLQMRQFAYALQGAGPLTKPPELTGIPTRRIIAAEIAAIEASLSIMGAPQGYNSMAFPWQIGSAPPYGKSIVTYTQQESVMYGDVLISYRLRLDPHQNRVGDFHNIDLGKYRKIYDDTLWELVKTADSVDKEKERIIASWMLKFAREGVVPQVEDIQQLQPMLSADIANNHLIHLIRIFYHCLVKEPVSLMICQDKDREVPLAICQLRAVKLVSEGYLSLSDVFNQDSPYGVFTGTNIKGSYIYELWEKVDRLNKLYMEKILLQKDDNQVQVTQYKQSFFGSNYPHESYPISTRAEIHEELKQFFGGDSDSDGEGYDSETEEIYFIPRV